MRTVPYRVGHVAIGLMYRRRSASYAQWYEPHYRLRRPPFWKRLMRAIRRIYA